MRRINIERMSATKSKMNTTTKRTIVLSESTPLNKSTLMQLTGNTSVVTRSHSSTEKKVENADKHYYVVADGVVFV